LLEKAKYAGLLCAPQRQVGLGGTMLRVLNKFGLAVVITTLTGTAYAQPLAECMQEQLKTAIPTMTVGEMKAECEQMQVEALENADKPHQAEHLEAVQEAQPDVSEAKKRMAMEQRTEWNPFVITPHRSNYILPYTYMKEPNQQAYSAASEFGEIDNAEAKLQVSLKVPLNYEDLFFSGDAIYFAFTLTAFWQVYNDDISAPFRETNYNPEFFYLTPLTSSFTGADTFLAVGLEHQSNGRTQLLSRSWNKVFLNYIYAKDNYLIQFRPWYRLPEDEKEDPLQASGDDNPDIYKYMGYFELTGTWEQNEYEFSLMLRNNMNSPNYGAVELNASFPLWGRLRGLVQYFNGYGESMIDYNHRVERLGIGVLLTEML